MAARLPVLAHLVGGASLHDLDALLSAAMGAGLVAGFTLIVTGRHGRSPTSGTCPPRPRANSDDAGARAARTERHPVPAGHRGARSRTRTTEFA